MPVVPVQAVLGTISMGAERKCFVVDAEGQPELRDIVVGMSNERLVEVKSGLKEGDQVVLNPAAAPQGRQRPEAGQAARQGRRTTAPGSAAPAKSGKGAKKKAARRKGPPARDRRQGPGRQGQRRPAARRDGLSPSGDRVPTRMATPAERRGDAE